MTRPTCFDGDWFSLNWCHQGNYQSVNRFDSTCKRGPACSQDSDCAVDECSQGAICVDHSCECKPKPVTTTRTTDDVGYYLSRYDTTDKSLSQTFHYKSPAKEHQAYPIGNIERRAYIVFDVANISTAISTKLRIWGWQTSTGTQQGLLSCIRHAATPAGDHQPIWTKQKRGRMKGLFFVPRKNTCEALCNRGA